MPLKIFRLLVALALALAIPLQGAASVTAGICMATGHHDAGAPASHAHGGDADHSLPHNDDPDTAHCAPCVGCCAAASIALAAQVCLLEDSPAAAIAVVPYLHPGSLPEELDRPPLAL